MSYNPNAAEAAKALENVNRGNGQPFENQAAFKRDTVFIAPSTLLTNQELFVTGEKDAMYKSKDFPSNTMAYSFDKIKLDFNLVFNADAQLNVAYVRHFLRNTFLDIRIEGKDVTKIPFDELVGYKILPTTDTDKTAAAPVDLVYQFASKINNVYHLPKPFVVNAKENPDITIVVAKGLTTAAWAAVYSPIIPNSGLTDDKGSYIQIEFQGIQSKLNF